MVRIENRVVENKPNENKSVDVKFFDFYVKEHKGNSHIKIRRRLRFPTAKYLSITGPKATVKCGSCGNKYKQSIFYSFSPFSIDETLKCKCGNTDEIHYKSTHLYP